ncbi:MAG: hypothetical protein FWD58_03140 [Firmicutes bacterium]|nr:hypothetical protein [Bacillota bacterium]
MYIKLNEDYEVKTTLGTIRDIEKAFGKSFFEVVNSVSTMKIEEQIKLLYVGLRKAHPEMAEAAFNALCEEYLGIGDLMEYLEKYFYALQYPGLSEEEVQDRIEKKLQKSREIRKMRSLTGT